MPQTWTVAKRVVIDRQAIQMSNPENSAARLAGVSLAVLCLASAQGQERDRSASAEVPKLQELRPKWLRWGPFDVTPSVTAGAYYDDNIFLARGKGTNSVSSPEDYVWTVAPSLRLGTSEEGTPYGRYLSLRYTPTASIFTKHGDQNSVDHEASVKGLWPFSKLALGAQQEFLSASSGVVEAGDRVDRTAYNTIFTVAYDLSEKTTISAQVSQRISEYKTLNSSKQWDDQNWFGYQYSPKLSIGFGFGLGYLDPQNSAQQTYENANLRAMYRVVEKIDLTASAGLEWRQFRGSQGSSQYPIFSIAGTFTPTPTTSLTLEAHRQQNSSIVYNSQNYTSTGFAVGAVQRIRERFSLTVSGSFDYVNYNAVQTGVATSRADEIIGARAELSYDLRPNWTVGVYYQRRDNLSDTALSFSNNQVGLLTVWSY